MDYRFCRRDMAWVGDWTTRAHAYSGLEKKYLEDPALDDMPMKYAAIALKMRKDPAQLTLASILDAYEVYAKPLLLKDGWRKVGWYPSCHGPLATAYCVNLWVKENKKAPLIPISSEGYPVLGCSSMFTGTWNPAGGVIYTQRVMSLHLAPLTTKVVRGKNWRKFATTELNKYYFWGLTPEEKDRFKYQTPKELGQEGLMDENKCPWQ